VQQANTSCDSAWRGMADKGALLALQAVGPACPACSLTLLALAYNHIAGTGMKMAVPHDHLITHDLLTMAHG
jgi:hypothetical protein